MNAGAERRFVRRSRVLLAVLWCGLAVVALRAAQLQIARHGPLAELARQQSSDAVKIPARRGHIYDRLGKPLAVSVDVPSVYANPSAVLHPRLAAHRLAAVLDESVRTLYGRLAGERSFAWLERQVSPNVAAEVEALHIRGVGITKEPRRFYPNRDIGAHVIGFAGVDAHGLEGIEKSLDSELSGVPQVVTAVRDARGHSVLQGQLDDARSSGADVWLTLDLQIQHAAAVALRQAVKQHEARSGMAVVLDVPTADVLAMAVEPHFNPNDPGDAPAADRRNRAITDMFEPGSSLKPLVVAAALRDKAVDPTATFFCENGAIQIGGHIIRDSHPHGWLNITQIIEKSSNIGAAKIGAALGRQRLAAALREYGFGRRTGVRFPGETPGILRPPATWSDVGLATISFGQGIAVSALQLATAYRVLASGGMYRPPRLVQRIQHPDGRVETIVRGPSRRILPQSITREVTKMMQAAVSPEGTGFRARVAGYQVAGKTGTSQKVDHVTGGYSSDRFVAVFAGFVPVKKPRVVIVVAIDEPQIQHSGGAVSAPVFSQIAEAAMSALGVVPTTPVQSDVRDALARVSAMAVDESPALDTLPPRPGTVPSFLGLTARQALARYAQMGLTVDLGMQGSGRVVRQVPAPGSKSTASRVKLVLAQQ